MAITTTTISSSPVLPSMAYRPFILTPQPTLNPCTLAAFLLLCQFLTKSPAIAVAMEKIAPLLGAGCLVHPLVGTLEGVLMAARDQRFHSLSYLILGAAFLAYQIYAREFNLGLVGVWAGLALFQWMRLVVFGVRVRHLLKVITPVARD